MTHELSRDESESGWPGRARELAPGIAARVEKAAEQRRIPEETLDELERAGFSRALQPARWGGGERSPAELFEVQWTLARVCPSSAWVLGVMAVHNWQLGLFPPEAQEEVWGQDPKARICSSYAPTGRVERVPGGFRLSGRWSFSSGCLHSGWAFLGGIAPPEDGAQDPIDMRTFLVPASDYRVDDVWHVVGLQATGSNDIVLDGAFVPEHRTHRMSDGFGGTSPGIAVNPAPLFRLPFGQVFVAALVPPAIGAAEGALEAFLSRESTRRSGGDLSASAESPETQALVGRARADLDGFKLLVRTHFAEMLELIRADEPISVERRVRYRYDWSRMVPRCGEIGAELLAASGAGAIFEGFPLQRYLHDLWAIRAHFVNRPGKPERNLGGVQLGLPNTDFLL
ncbi:MAG: flavin-dependent monooxygenase [Myxococcales bacterium]|nr:flavin-dependent monooxygenase [Myxococcales bacterium]